MAAQKQFEALQQEYVKLQQDRAKLIDLKYENELVKKDMQGFDHSTPIFKMNGPTLVPQNLEDAKQQVENKISFIGKQIEQLDKQMKEKEGLIIEANRQRLAAQAQQKK